MGASSGRFWAAGTYPLPVSTVNSMSTRAFSSSVQITTLGSMIWMPWPAWICAAVTSPGPDAVSVIRLGPSPCMRSASSFKLSTMSVMSSRTPWSEENSCSTPLICIDVTAAPCSDDRRMRLSALPSVMP